MRPSKIALYTTAGAVIAGSAGLVWMSSHRSTLEGRRSMQMIAADVLSPRVKDKIEASNARVSEVLLAPSASQVGPAPGLINASFEASQNAMIATQKLIRTGQVSLEVKLFDEAFAKLQRIASENGGYIADIKANRQDQGRASGTVVVRVQPNRYFQSLDALRTIGKVEHEGVNTQDVTREYADLEARLTNKRRLEARMRELLSTRAAKMGDLLEAEQQLSQVTEQIEQMEGQKRYFQQMVSMSTITVELHEPLVVTKLQKPGLFAPVAVAASNSIELLVQFLALLVSALVFLAPWLVLGTGTWVAIRRLAIRRKAAQEG
jgi:hypothetical protein